MNTIVKTFGNITMLEVLAFLIPFVIAVYIDLRSHKKSSEITMGNAVSWALVWVFCAALFAGFVWWDRGADAASLFTTGYVLEKALAIDNLFAFFLIFKSFGLTTKENQHHQHTILYWGILGAIAFRVLFLGAGALIVNLSPYILVLFAAIILWTVIQMWRSGENEEEVDYTKHWSVLLTKKFVKVHPSLAGGKFFVGSDKETPYTFEGEPFHRRAVTPMFLCLVCIEVCDVVFAFDSMPTIVAVVRDPYLMITASLWAAAGLRTLYFILVAARNMFWALDKAVMVLLIFISGKLIGNAFGWHIPNVYSLTIVVSILAIGVGYSLLVINPAEEENANDKIV